MREWEWRAEVPDGTQGRALTLSEHLLHVFDVCGGLISQCPLQSTGAAQIDGQPLHFEDCRDGARPARRLLAFHAMVAIQHAEAQGWIDKGSVEVPNAGAWPWLLPREEGVALGRR
jgi:hypothetical protein